MAKVLFSPAAERDLNSLERSIQTALRDRHIQALERNPRIGKMLHGPLRGYFSYDFWEGGVSYRIAYEILREIVILLMIDKRENFYKKFSRRIH